MRLVVSLLVLRAALGAEQCGDFVCFHNSKCASGPPDFSNQPDAIKENLPPESMYSVHCECTAFYTGVDCSIPVENCDDGVHRCLHGGTCYLQDTESLPYCDCSTAMDLNTGMKYVGQYCEQEESGGNYCTDHPENVKSFCLNDGTCNPAFPASSSDPCVCTTGYKGAHCELPDTDGLRDCNLQCKNGGICRLGEDGDPSPVETHFSSTSNPPDSPSDHMHCECPEGYFGSLCEQQIETKDCGGTFQCMRGAPCKTDDGGTPYCDCEALYDPAVGGTPQFFAGAYCQYPSTDYCGEAGGQHYYCANFGTCLGDENNPSLGCDCLDGWAGDHCEYNEDYDCTLDCGDNGTCKIQPGPIKYDYNLSTDNKHHHDYQHCECDPGYSGTNCEVIEATRDAESNRCGDMDYACLNGGKCEPQPDGTYACNCLDAQGNGVYYDGKYCQYPSTSICEEDDDTDEVYFCTNMGQCPEDFRDGCSCYAGFGGFSCEFAKSDCTMQCQNGGECMLGSPPDESYLEAYWFNADDYANWQYCKCPVGFHGKYCEMGSGPSSTEQCDNGMVCLNGGSCFDEDGVTPMTKRCNCLNAQQTGADGKTTFFDGLYCQFASTVHCGTDTDGSEYFCMNGGLCDKDWNRKGCKCPEGYAGFSCELVEGVDCDLECNNGKCRLGAPESGSHAHAYWYDPDAQEDYQYCECNDGGNGGKYCDTKGDDCGDFTCLNGGSCKDEYGKPMVDRCNCLDAQAKNNGGKTVYFDGRFCQYPSTSVCYEDDEETYFCMNGGKCPTGNIEDPCDCPYGYTGHSCEFLVGTDCTLDCGEDGECRLGSPPGTSHAHAYWFDPDAQGDFQYCECKNGAGGKYCDQKGDVCDSFTCLNGGTCTDEYGEPMVDRCNCLHADATNTGGETVYFDGRFCQYPSTSVCYEGDDQSYFCMNGGKCPTTGNVEDPCDCPYGYTGHSCEFLVGTDCNLDCGSHGTCRLGAPPGGSHAHAYWFDPDSQENYQYCECEAGWGGKFCEAAGEDCGDFTCLNKGRCDKTMPDRCDCIHAWEEGEGSIPDIYYEGRFCQYASTSVCDETSAEIFFCVNDGVCGKDDKTSCTCPDGFSGHSCEFITGTDCTLDCQNGGTCRLGSPPGTDYLHAYWYEASAQDNYQYCECPNGFDGKLCDAPTKSCGKYDCLNGGKCGSPSGKDLGRCDCNDAYDSSSGTYFDGLYCQFPSTSVCYESDTDSFFCMNGGICRDDYTLGCDCPEGYGGFYCELQSPQDCTLPCMNGGECVLGSPPGISSADAYWNNEEKSGDYQYCSCPEGFSGELCQDQGSEMCGEHACENGGTCVTRTIDGKEVKHCDCRTAQSGNVFYAGTYCQYQSTSVCQQDDDTAYFCVNYGQCKQDYRSGCTCQANTRGFSCEFVLDSSSPTSPGGTAAGGKPIIDTNEQATCSLDCNGHGTCRKGVKDISDLEDAVNAGHLSYTHDDLEHCVCQEGWTGIYCDHEITQCTENHFCLHGSECVQGQNACDCSTATSTISTNFAGDNCEHVADVCVVGSQTIKNGSPESYCANGGKCTKYIGSDNAEHPGCICPQGFVGDRCEYTINKSDTKGAGDDDHSFAKTSSGSGSVSGVGIAAIILSVCAVVAVTVYTVNSCVRRKRFTRRRDGESSGLIWASKGGYKDNAETINFAPNKGGYTEDYMASFANPSRDPMATALAPDTADAVDAIESDTSTGRVESDDEPQVFIGPPTDEDGHVLHSVDII